MRLRSIVTGVVSERLALPEPHGVLVSRRIILNLPSQSILYVSETYSLYLNLKHYLQPLLPPTWRTSLLQPNFRDITRFRENNIMRPALALPGLRGHLSENIRHGRNEEVDDVEMKWERFLEGNPKDVEALKIVLYGKMRKGKPAEAVKYVERLIQLEGDEVEWRLLQALCYEMMGHFTTAKRLFKDILKGKPLLLRALHGLAMVMHKNNEGPAVFEMLNKALELSRREKRVTEERNISILIAQMHVVKGELEEGLTKFQGLIDENPRDFRPYLCQGIILSLLNRKEEAEQQFNTYRTLVPEEFPQRRFLDDIVFEAKTKSREPSKRF
uniref:Uncharacterized protein n=1 Tax=Kalanchoe fedtschenkoi TaxID=63787 RepID=A0A7N0U0T1_KALFE